MRAVIMAGGLGTRLGEIKSLAKIGGVPLILHQLAALRDYDVTVITGYGHDAVAACVGNRAVCVRETHSGGTAQALLTVRNMQEPFLLVYGDIMFDMRTVSMFGSTHIRWDAVVAVQPTDHMESSDLVQVKDGVLTFAQRPARNLACAGIHAVHPRAFSAIGDRLDFCKDVLPLLCVVGYRTSEYIKDVGTPERLCEAREDYKRLRCWGRTAVFLDRDGVLTAERGYNENPAALLPGAAEAVRRINRSGHLAILVSNQACVGRGECSVEQLEAAHVAMDAQLAERAAKLDDVLVCPHVEGTCSCRKPCPNMLYKALLRHNLHLQYSYFIGNSPCDVQCANSAGVKSVLVGDAAADPWLRVPDLLSAVEAIL